MGDMEEDAAGLGCTITLHRKLEEFEIEIREEISTDCDFVL